MARFPSVEKLKAAAAAENNDDVMHFVEKFVLHAQIEEQVLYPPAILVGGYIKMKGHK